MKTSLQPTANSRQPKKLDLRKEPNVSARRKALEKELDVSLQNIGSYSLDEKVASTINCENMIGVAQVPMGVAGPLQIKSLKFKVKSYYLPLATTEGALVASVSRGCKAITESGGSVVDSYRVGTTRGPVFYTGSIGENQRFYEWIKTHEKELAEVAESTSHHLIYKKAKVITVGKYAYVRFSFNTHDAMGMNMVTAATTSMYRYIEAETGFRCISVAGNYDIDKKAAWINFLEGRGIKVWAEVTLTNEVLKKVLKTSAANMYEVWLAKCMVGSVMSGSLGFNAQFANVVAALFLATGQDLGHVGEGSMGVTTTEIINDDLYVSVYLPDLMVGTVGGGTGLATQKEALEMLGVAGGAPAGEEGKNAEQFAEIVGAAVLAGEISLLASLSEGTLAKAHERLGRGKVEK